MSKYCDEIPVIDFFKFKIVNSNIEGLASEISSNIEKDRKGLVLSCINPHSYYVAKGDLTFKASLENSDWLIPDGIGIIWASKLLSSPIKNRLAGPDLFAALSLRLNNLGGVNVFFLGSTEENLSVISSRYRSEFPNVKICGTYSPPFEAAFNEIETKKIIDKINMSKANVLWVGMTAPKQEKWIFLFFSNLNLNFACGIGAAFDFYSGKVRRPSIYAQKFGLEWFSRLLRDPAKLWRRTFISGLYFVFDVIYLSLHNIRK